MGIQSASKLISERDELQAYQRGSLDVGGGGRDVFAQPQQGDARPQNGEKKKKAQFSMQEGGRAQPLRR